MTTQRTLKILSIIAILFGVLTILSGGLALFGDVEARASVGNAVGFVLWFNFIAGFAYVLTGFAMWRGLNGATGAAKLLVLTTALVLAAFSWHVMAGGAYEMRTVGALVLRLLFWVAVAAVAKRTAKLAKTQLRA
jgi:hypothetical protein